MKHQIDIAPNNAIYIDGKRVVGRKPYGLFETKTIQITDSDLIEIVNRCEELIKEADDDYFSFRSHAEVCDRPQMDCSLCWKELHCRAIEEAEKRGER